MGNRDSTSEAEEAPNDSNDYILLSKHFNYKYKKRRCHYRSEQLEISPKEMKRIQQLTKDSTDNSSDDMKVDSIMDRLKALSDQRPLKVIIDTDIGTDIDDVLTLLQLIHMPKSDIQCIGITTNYHPTKLRAYVAKSILNAAIDTDFHSIPIVSGNSYLCGTHREFFHAGNEAEGLYLTKDEQAELWALNEDKVQSDAVEFIWNAMCKEPGQITLVSIGIPTNIGACIQTYGAEKFGAVCGAMVVMGGGSVITKTAKLHGAVGVYSDKPKEWKHKGSMTQSEIGQIKAPFELPHSEPSALDWAAFPNQYGIKPIHFFPNHNISGDTLASVLLFSVVNCPISVIPHHITGKHWLKGTAIETLLSNAVASDELNSQFEMSNGSDKSKLVWSENEVGVCGALLREWFRVRRGQRGQCPHDPLTLYEAVYPIQSTKQESTESEEKKQTDNESGGNENIQRRKFEAGQPCLTYVRGTFVCHQWAAFLTFVPNPKGPHRLARYPIDALGFTKWCGDTLINSIPSEKQCTDAGNYQKIMASNKLQREAA